MERRRRRLPPRHPPLVAAGRGHRADPAATARRPRSSTAPRAVLRGRQAAGARRRGHAGRRSAAPPSRGHPDDRAEADRHRPRRPPRPRARVGRGPSRPCWCAPTRRPTCSPRRSARRASPTACGAAPPSSTGPRSAGPCASSATPPCRSARRWPTSSCSRLELDDEARARVDLRRRRRRPSRACLDRQADEQRARAPCSAWAATTCASIPIGRADTLRRVAHGHRAVGGRHRRPGRDAVDVATFHAAKGLEWATVHLAGVEDGYVPIAHARTAAAQAEEVAAPLRRHDPGRAGAAHHLGRAPHVRRPRRRAPSVAAPRSARGTRRPRRPPIAEPRAPIDPPVDDWTERGRPAARAPATLEPDAGRPGARRAARLARRRRARRRGSNRRPCCPTTCWPGSSPRAPARRRGARGGPRASGRSWRSRFGDAILGALAHPADAATAER